MKVEILHAPGCTQCDKGLPALRDAAKAADPHLDWRELDVLKSVE